MKLPRQIYVIQHGPTKKRYVGSSVNAQRRFNQHLYRLRHGIHPVEDMQADFDRYGEDYTLTVIGEITTRAERELEYGWMLIYATYDRRYGYNYLDPAMARQTAPGSRWKDPELLAIFEFART